MSYREGIEWKIVHSERMNCTAHALMAPMVTVGSWLRHLGEPEEIGQWQLAHLARVNDSVTNWRY